MYPQVIKHPTKTIPSAWLLRIAIAPGLRRLVDHLGNGSRDS
jgi:hypothetical protein